MVKVKKKPNVVSINRASDKKNKMRFFKLGWELLGHKFLYYKGSDYKLGNKVINDSEYDDIEDEYKELAKELDLPTSASDMVGFKETRPSCRMVMEHLIATKGRFPGTVSGVRKEVTKVRKVVNGYHVALIEVMEEIGVKENTMKKIRLKMKKRMRP